MDVPGSVEQKAASNVSVFQKEKVSSYLYFSSLYFITAGALYLWGYWETFSIHILEYLSLADVVKSTAYQVASACIATVIGGVIGELLSTGNAVPEGAGRNTRIGMILLRIWPYIVMLYCSVTLGILILGPVEKWNYLPVMFALPMYVVAKSFKIFESFIPHERTRSILVFMLAVIPTAAYGAGRLEADKIMRGTEYQYLASALDGLQVIASEKAKEQIRFIGHAGDHIFFFDPNKSAVIISKLDTTKPLVLKKFKESR